MIHRSIEGATHRLESEALLPAVIRVEKVTMPGASEPVQQIATAWEPTPAELDALNKGASIHVLLVGGGLPDAIDVVVGEAP